MREGYWINWRTGDVIEIDEHERWIRRPDNREKLGIGSMHADHLCKKFRPIEERDRFLILMMKSFPVMRVRGHGVTCTFEFYAEDADPVLGVILGFCQGEGGCGDWTGLTIVNFARARMCTMPFREFRRRMKRRPEENILSEKLNLEPGIFSGGDPSPL